MSKVPTPTPDRPPVSTDGLLERPAPKAVPTALATPTPRLWGRSTWLSIGFAAAILIVLVSMVDWRAVWQEIRNCDPWLAALGGLCHYATYQIRGVRWRRSLRHLHGKAGSWRFGLLVFFYNFVDNVVPGKLGDVYGAHLARINLGITRPAALGSIVFLRMIDSWVVLGLAALSSSLVFSDQLPESVVWTLILGGIIAAAASVILLTFALTRRIAPERLPESVRKRVEGFRSGMWPRRREWATILVLTTVIWALETAWILFLAMAFGIELGFGQLLFLTMIPLIASAFPLTPAGAGVVELSLYGCLRAVDVSATVAASLTVLNRFIDYWLHIFLGFVTWLVRGRIGLRTWREVPIDPADAGFAPPASGATPTAAEARASARGESPATDT